MFSLGEVSWCKVKYNLIGVHVYGLLMILVGLAYYGKSANDFQDWLIKPTNYKNYLYWSVAGYAIAFLGTLAALFTSFNNHKMVKWGSSAVMAAGLVCLSIGASIYMDKYDVRMIIKKW